MKILPYFSPQAARRDLADALQLNPDQRAALNANPDKFIDDHFGDDCCGQTRSMLGGGPSTIEAFRGITPFEAGMLIAMGLAAVAFLYLVLHGATPR